MNIYKKILRSKTGMTLIELIAGFVILGIIMVPISYLMYDSQAEFVANETKIAAQNAVNNAMRDIFENLNKVDKAFVDSTYNTIEILSLPVAAEVPNDPGIPDISSYIILRYDDKEIIYGINNNNQLCSVVNSNVLPASNRKDVATLNSVINSPGGKVLLDNVERLCVTQTGGTYKFVISADPKDYGKKIVNKITLTNSFSPRFNMDIR